MSGVSEWSGELRNLIEIGVVLVAVCKWALARWRTRQERRELALRRALRRQVERWRERKTMEAARRQSIS